MVVIRPSTCTSSEYFSWIVCVTRYERIFNSWRLGLQSSCSFRKSTSKIIAIIHIAKYKSPAVVVIGNKCFNSSRQIYSLFNENLVKFVLVKHQAMNQKL